MSDVRSIAAIPRWPPWRSSWTIEVHDRTDVGDRVESREAEAALHNHQSKLLQRAARRIGVDGAERARMAGVDRAQEAHRLAAAKLAEDDAVGAEAKRRLQQIVRRDASLARLALHRDQADAVAVAETDLRRVLDEDDALMLGNFAKQRIEESRLAARRAARDQDRRAAAYGLAQEVDVARCPARDRARTSSRSALASRS